MEVEYESGTDHDWKVMHPDTVVDGEDLSTLSRKLSSSSSNSLSKDCFVVEDPNESSSSSRGSSGHSKHGRDSESASELSEEKFPVSSIFKQEESDDLLEHSSLPVISTDTPEINLNNVSTTQSPPVQIMEQPGEPGPYRIPSSVFARSKSTTPLEWSVASNESLFSLHMGNMSFTNDQMLLLGRSGELGKPGDPDLSGQLLINSSGECLQLNKASFSGNLGEHSVSESAAETVNGDVSRIKANTPSKENLSLSQELPRSSSSSSSSCHSDESGVSHQSFAFPVLADVEKVASVKPGQGQQNVDSQPELQPEFSETKPAAAQTTWFSFFTCCSSCY